MSPEVLLTPVDLAREPPFRLAEVDVRPATREVLGGDGRRHVLEPRVMQVLVALARRPGEVVSRDELIQLCWAGRVVGEDAINRCIGALRRLAQAYAALAIDTVARVGYRLKEGPGRTCGDIARPGHAALVAVLPFENLAAEADMACFCDGVAEEIVQAIACHESLKVIGRASSFQFRGGQKVISEVAERLRATHVLDGSVRRSGAQVRVSAHLIECRGQTVLWSARFDRELLDVFALQEGVAKAVAAAVKQAVSRPT